METRMTGNKIAEARKKLNISQAQLAENLFISAQAVGKWERGESMPDIITLNRLAVILGVDLNYFSENFQSSFSETRSIESSENKSDDLPIEKRNKKTNWDMSNLNLVDSDFSGLKNLHEKFSSSNMQRCLFIGSEMAGLLLKNNNVDSCNFSKSDINSSHIQNSNLVNNQFKACSLRGTEFSGSYISGCDFTDADFTGVIVRSGGLEKNTIVNTVWNRTKFIDTHLVDTDFKGILEECSFENCAFTKVKFQNATLINTFFKNNKKLKRVQFIDCKADKITYAFLKSGNADLTGISVIKE
ncbi:MAG: pentapeptide repeat-containing protein [Prolixibacteraceae bacterium]|nr:pentapeptide repeat-containing protein [Prolixibacteraceae bacterium]